MGKLSELPPGGALEKRVTTSAGVLRWRTVWWWKATMFISKS